MNTLFCLFSRMSGVQQYIIDPKLKNIKFNVLCLKYHELLIVFAVALLTKIIVRFI